MSQDRCDNLKEFMDIEKIRRDFPILDRKVYGRPLIYFDNTASSQTPRRVVDKICNQYFNHKANVHRGVHCLSQEATDDMEWSRRRVAGFINASGTDEIIFTRGTTESLNLVASSYCQLLEPGDEIIITVMEHHSNIVPWQMQAQRLGLALKVVPIMADGSLDMDAYRSLLSPRTRIVSVCHVSNVLGIVNPVAQIIALAHQNGAIAVIDGAQAVAHGKVDVQALGADFYAFSSHKMYGPTGIGILYGRRELLQRMPPYQGGGEMIGHVSFSGTTWAELPFKFEAGTPDYVGAAAFGTAIDYLEELGLENVAAHEHTLLLRATEAMNQIQGMRIFGSAPGKDAIISFVVGNIHPYDLGMLLDKMGVAVRTGHHCAQPLMEVLGVEGTVRASFAAYNTASEVDQFISILERAVTMLS